MQLMCIACRPCIYRLVKFKPMTTARAVFGEHRGNGKHLCHPTLKSPAKEGNFACLSQLCLVINKHPLVLCRVSRSSFSCFPSQFHSLNRPRHGAQGLLFVPKHRRLWLPYRVIRLGKLSQAGTVVLLTWTEMLINYMLYLCVCM